MEECEIKAIQKQVRILLHKYTNSIEGFEDCAQEIIGGKLAGKKQRINQGVIDWLRSQHGDKRNSTFKARQNHWRYFELGDHASYTNKQAGKYQQADKALSNLEPIDRAVYLLINLFGLTNDEVGYLFGFSVSRANQRLKRAEKLIRQGIK